MVMRVAMTFIRWCTLVVALVVAPAGTTALAQSAEQPVGRVKVIAGTAVIVRAGQNIAAAVGSDVLVSDELRTGRDGRIGLILRDETRLTLGPDSQMALAQFAYAPEEGRLALVVRLARGVLSYVSGLIAKLAPSAVRLQTPTAVIGVRGTHVLLKVEGP
jgi:hypothetical protein